MHEISHQALLGQIDLSLKECQNRDLETAHSLLIAIEQLQRTMDLLRAHRPYYHWVGIYGLIGDTLYLGPFAGPPTEHVEIPVGRGVCGTAVATRLNQIVDDVTTVGNYLACNLDTKSELVVLIWSPDGNKILGQIDVDGSIKKAFDPLEEAFLTAVATRLAKPLSIWLSGREDTLIPAKNHHKTSSKTQEILT